MPAPKPHRVPVSTYRLQLGSNLTLFEAAALIPYLARLGVTECYCSPILAARPGSTHGYDLCDHAEVNPALGGPEGLAALSAAAAAHGLGLVIDFVPNHMSADPVCNRWWRSVLENGPSSPFAPYFDIDWKPVKPELEGKVLLPILGDQYGIVLHSGGLRLGRTPAGFRLLYGDFDLPLNPRQLKILLDHDRAALERSAEPGDADVTEYLSILFHLDHLPPYTVTEPAKVAERLREKDVALGRLSALAERSEKIRQHLDQLVARFNGTPGDDASFDPLHRLLEAQPYRLAYWRTAMDEINYRRFFDVNELIGIRMEDPVVFEAAHATIGRLLREGVITGLRLDHVDGLYDPAAYLESLAAVAEPGWAPWVVVEKIVSPGERLDQSWHAHGTTGYEFLDLVNGLFVHPAGSEALVELYARLTGDRLEFEDVVYSSKKLIATTTMAAELHVLAHEANRISERHRTYRDFTLSSLREALEEIVACFPVYRTYVREGGGSEADAEVVDRAIAEALRRNPVLEPTIFAFLRRLLLPPEGSGAVAAQVTRFAMKFQQYSGPVQAKGVEDTVFYRHVPLASLNEVGGGPIPRPDPPGAFHSANAERLASWPLAMLSTATHDTKRGEDARMRINVLSEMPRRWNDLIIRLRRVTRPARTLDTAPDPSDEYLLYQTLVGIWPPGPGEEPDVGLIERVKEYMIKAIREAKVHSSWINPSAAYERGVLDFVDGILAGPAAPAFSRSFVPFARQAAWIGMLGSLAQVVLKIGSPGVPDFYQGTELWSTSLVDPDNRRAVDFAARNAALNGLEPLLEGREEAGAAYSDLVSRWMDGRIKLLVTAAGLRLRRRHPELFLWGDYVPLAAEGVRRAHLVSFARTSEDGAVLIVAPRLLGGLLKDEHRLPPSYDLWRDTAIALPDRLAGWSYRNAITAEALEQEPPRRLSVARALRTLPVGLFVATANP